MSNSEIFFTDISGHLMYHDIHSSIRRGMSFIRRKEKIDNFFFFFDSGVFEYSSVLATQSINRISTFFVNELLF